MPKAELSRRLKWFGIGTAVVLLILGILILSAELRLSDAEVRAAFMEAGVECDIYHLPYEDASIRYIVTGLNLSQADVGIIFIHGAPGASDGFYPYQMDSSLLASAALISVDRLGYGYSDYGHPQTSLVAQANAVQAVMDQLGLPRYILVSHSYGCPVAGALSAISSSHISATIMVCPVIDPAYEKIFFFSSWPSQFPLKYISSGAMYAASVEKMTHADELNKIESLWTDVDLPTIIMHGMRDWIAPPQNAAYLNDKVAPSLLTVDIDSSASHFIIWNQMPQVMAYIHQYL